MTGAAVAAACPGEGNAAARLGGRVEAVPVAGGDIVVETVGQGPSVLFVHGWTLDRRAWTPQAEALSRHWRTLAFDRRGCGQSTAPSSLAAEPDDVSRLLDHAGIARCVIVAMSQGTRVALAFAARCPDRVAGLVLQGPPPLLPGERSGDEAMPVAAMRRHARDGRWDELGRLWRGHPLLALPGGEGATLLRAMVDDYRARDLLDPDEPLAVVPAALSSIGAPVLLLCGEHESPTRKAAAARLAALLPRARTATVPGGAHLCNLCSPRAYNAILTDFLQQVALS